MRRVQIIAVLVVLLMIVVTVALSYQLQVRGIDIPRSELVSYLIFMAVVMISVIFAALTLIYNPKKDRVVCVYDSLGRPKGLIPHGLHTKSIADRISNKSCPIPDTEQIIPFSWEMIHASAGDILIVAAVVVAVGSRPVDVDKACRSGYSESSIIRDRIANWVEQKLLYVEGMNRQTNIGLSLSDTQIQLETWIGQSLSETGWYLVRVEDLKLNPADLALQN